jgi:DNA repair protein RadC
VADFFREYFSDRCNEEFWIVLLSTANVVVSLSQISAGGLAASIVEPRAVFRTAILANAAAIICLHNHPSGAPRGAYVEC